MTPEQAAVVEKVRAGYTSGELAAEAVQAIRARVSADVEQSREWIRKRDEQRAEQERRNARPSRAEVNKVTFEQMLEEARAEEAEQDVRLCGCGEPSGKLATCAPCQRKKYDAFNHAGGKGHPGYKKLIEEIAALHVVKSGGYGTGEDPFANFSSVARESGRPRYVYAMERAQEKLSRCFSLHAQGRIGDLEEEFKDIASLFLCAEAMRRQDQEGGSPCDAS